MEEYMLTNMRTAYDPANKRFCLQFVFDNRTCVNLEFPDGSTLEDVLLELNKGGVLL